MAFKINRVYTRSGDKGETSLIDGSRVLKSDPRCSAFGGLDEASSHLGLARDELKVLYESSLSKEKKQSIALVYDVIEYLQQELFDLGSELATPMGFEYQGMWKASSDHVTKLEELIDYFNKDLKELDSFILPGGDKSASHLHVARTVIRRVEREIVGATKSDASIVSSAALQYCNRLSDLLFVLSRYILQELEKQVPLWKKGELRKFPLS
jgi:cob(I)alamin adenosyltransferase